MTQSRLSEYQGESRSQLGYEVDNGDVIRLMSLESRMANAKIR